MIYFDAALQERVHDLFHESLVRLGILALGLKESVEYTGHRDDYEPVDRDERIYRKVR